MSHFATNTSRADSASPRAQVVAEAVVSAYIDEIARPGRRQQRAAHVPSHTATRTRPPAARSRTLMRRRRPVAVELGAR
jgi:hypothetical protein